MFARLDQKTQIIGKFWENLQNFWWKFYRKIEFLFYFFIIYYLFLNLLLKIEPSEITPFFYNNFFGLGGRGFPPSPWLRPWTELLKSLFAR